MSTNNVLWSIAHSQNHATFIYEIISSLKHTFQRTRNVSRNVSRNLKGNGKLQYGR